MNEFDTPGDVNYIFIVIILKKKLPVYFKIPVTRQYFLSELSFGQGLSGRFFDEFYTPGDVIYILTLLFNINTLPVHFKIPVTGKYFQSG